ncbi:MAG: M14 family metallopeptidase [Ilumatobacteraceae bacterium]
MSFEPASYDFDRFLRYDDMVAWLQYAASRRPDLITLETYGHSYEGRKLWVIAITDSSTGAHDTKPAHWVDANIHAVEVTGGVAALYLVHHLMQGFETGDAMVTEALRTRTFYVAPRVNPDGVEAALADRPSFHRSSVRSWPWTDGHRWPGLHHEDVDGDGRILTMRLPDPNGAWIEHPDDARVMMPVPLDGLTDRPRYRLLTEGRVVDFDGFTVPTPRDPAGLDLNRNFPAGWSTSVLGSGDHPLSEPEIDALVRAVRARPNVCGYNAYHTFGGVLLRPSSTRADSSLPPSDVWTWNEFGKRGTELTGYKVHSVYEDFTWDKSDVMSGAGDDWAYEHLGVISWTTEFWDVIHHATGERAHTFIWYEGPTTEQELAVAKWTDENAPGSYVPWRTFDHPDLGTVEIGGCDFFHTWTNPPLALLKKEVIPHAEFAVHQALASPRLTIGEISATSLGSNTWRVAVGVSNTGWLPTDVSAFARKNNLVLPVTVEISVAGGEVVGSPARVKLGQLEGRAGFRLNGGAMSDGTPDRARHEWVVSARPGSVVEVDVRHPRTGRVTGRVTLEA